MEEKALPAPSGPATQEAAAVRVLITYVNRLHGLPVPESDEDLPEFYRLAPSGFLPRSAGTTGGSGHLRQGRLLSDLRTFANPSI